MKTQEKTSHAKMTTNEIDPVVHFEIPADDSDRISDFYEEAFGWQTKQLGEDSGNYVLATTTSEVDREGRPKRVGIINGGFYTRDNKKPAQYPSIVIAVEDIKKSMHKISKAGGKVLGEPMDIPGFGKYVSFYDTEGNRLSIMEPTEEMKNKSKEN